MPEALNTFTEGMIMDVHPLMTPNNMLTNALNATIITYNGNEFMLQNDMGNGRVETAYLPAGYVPVGVKEYGGIIYIASYNPLKNQSQIGCFPSPERLISSDEMELPKLKLVDSIFGIDGSEEYKRNGASSEYLKLDIFDKEQIFNPGDQFMIAIKNDDGSNDQQIFLKLISEYGGFKNGEDEYRNVTIHLALIDESGNITYVENDLLKQDNDYWMPYYEDDIVDNLQDPDQYRASIGNKDKYNIYRNKISGQLYLIVELEGIQDFDFTRRVKSIVTPISGTDEVDESFQVTFTGSSLKYTLPGSTDLKGYEFFYDLYEVDDNGNYQPVPGGKDTVIINEERTPVNPNVGDRVKVENIMFPDILGKLNFTRKHLLKYTATPYTDFLFLERFKKSGLINFAHINSGVHTLTEWRYYVDNNTITLSYGFDYNPLEGVNARKVYFELYDFSGDFSVYYKARSRDNWSGNFTDVISFNTVEPTHNDGNVRTYTGYGDETGLNPLIQLPKNNKYYAESTGEPIQTLKKNNLYLVRICIEEDMKEETGEYRETEFYKFLYTTPIFNENYINDFDTISDFSTIEPTYFSELLLQKTNENTFLLNIKTTGNFFSLRNPPADGLLVTDSVGQIKATAQLALTSKLINEDRYFGNYQSELFITSFNFGSGTAVTSVPESTYIQDGFASEDMIAKIESTSDDLDAATYTLTAVGGTGKIGSFLLNGTVGRRIVGDTTPISLTYEGKILQQFFKDEYFNADTYNKIDVEKRIACLGTVGSETSDSGIMTFHFMGNVFGMSRNDSGVVNYTSTGSAGIVDRRYGKYLDDVDLQRILKDLVNEGLYDSPAIIPVCGTNGDKASYQLKDGRENTSAWQYVHGDELSAGQDFILIAWQCAPGSGIGEKEYVIINMGSKAGNNFDSWGHFGRKPLGQAAALILSKFYLVQYDDFDERVYIAENLVYNTQFDTTYTSKIKINPISGTNLPIFRFLTINDGIQDFTKSNIAYLISLKINGTINNLSYNNIPNDINDNLGKDLEIANDSISEIDLNYNFGKSIRMATLELAKYKNPQNYILTDLQNRIVDEDGGSVDANGDEYSTSRVYVKNMRVLNSSGTITNITDNKYYPYDNLGSVGARGFTIPEINGNGGNYFTGGVGDKNRFKTSYSIYGMQKGVLNIPLLNPDGPNIICKWTQSTDRDAPDIKKNVIFSSTYATSKTESSYDSKHGNNRSAY